MNVSFDDIRGEVLPAGQGRAHLVARVPGIVIVIRRDGTAGEAAAAELLALIRQAAVDAAPAPGRDLARRLTEWVVRTRSVPGFGTVAATEDGIAVYLHGDVGVAELPEPGIEPRPEAERLQLSGRTAAFTVDRLLPWPAGPVMLAAGRPDDPEEGGTSIGVLGWSGLVEGLVPGDGIVLGAPKTAAGTPAGRHASPLPSVQAAVQAALPTPEPEPTAPHPLPEPAVEPEPVAVAPPAPPSDRPAKLRPPKLSEQIHGSHEHVAPRAPLPVADAGGAVKPAKPKPGAGGPAHVLVKGFRCSRNHHNDPRVSFCSVCGIRMDQRTGVLVDGRRPPLGLLVLDIGSTFVLDDNYLLGRNPEVDDAVISSRLRPIRLDDDSGTLSRVHAEIRLEGWDVLLLDRGSANGTYVAAAGQSGWNRLAPHRPIVLTPGTHVRIGRRMFTFESAHARL